MTEELLVNILVISGAVAAGIIILGFVVLTIVDARRDRDAAPPHKERSFSGIKKIESPEEARGRSVGAPQPVRPVSPIVQTGKDTELTPGPNDPTAEQLASAGFGKPLTTLEQRDSQGPVPNPLLQTQPAPTMYRKPQPKSDEKNTRLDNPSGE